ncbi:MAG: hypothetical protein JKY65_19450, partial [Planctomycetes bacterium]|nr:hypothetical protein [Planctomycetota bacterium]
MGLRRRRSSGTLPGSNPHQAAEPPPTQGGTITSRSRDALIELVAEGLIDGIVCQLKSGKEADIYVVEHGPYHYVAKVYRKREFRSFKNDAGYREGRNVRNTRTKRALEKNSKFGQKQAEEAWRMSEVEALRSLQASGASVPRILTHHEETLVMELICDDNGELAPQLAQVSFDPESARVMYDKILEQVVILLLNDLVHGDLSPYNVLVRKGEPVVIDFPQCVSAAHNQQASNLLERDLYAISQHLGIYDPEIRELGKQSWQIWAEYEAGRLERDFRPDSEKKRAEIVGDLASLVGFVQEANEEADLERRAAEGDEDARALLRAADRRARRRADSVAAEAERRADEEAAHEEAKRRSERRAKGKSRGGGRGKRGKSEDKASSESGRTSGRHGRGGKPGGGEGTGAQDERSGESSGDRPRRRRRRRGGGG